MLRRCLPLACAISLLACVAHEKSGDRAAALGDWKLAEQEYGAAVAKDPGKKELQEKYSQARTAALGQSTRQAQTCAAGRDWECALAESDYALRLDPASPGMAALRRDAAREAGTLRLRRAEEAVSAGDLAGGLQLLESARAVTDDPGVQAESRRVQPRIVGPVVQQAERLRGEKRYAEALDLLGRAARVDASVGPRVDAVRAEFERWKDSEAERLAAEGDGLLAARRYADAKARYDSALQLRPQCRALPLSRYAAALAQGADAAARRDWPTAERAFAEAARLEPGRTGVAAAELDRVRIRPYAIRLRSVLVRPTRPDGWPWAGARTRDLEHALARLARLDAASGRLPAGLAIDVARRIPPENQPTLVVAVGLPDGRALQSSPRRGAYAMLDGSFVVATNAYDDRALSIRVVHDDGAGRPVDVGVVDVRVAELVSRGELALSGASIAELLVEAGPADRPEGAYSGMAPIPDAASNVAPAWSSPTPASRGYRILALDASASPADAAVAPGQPPAELLVEIEQRGAVVYRAPAARGPTSARWTPAAAYLFVEPQEVVTVRLVRVDPRGGARPVLAQPVAGRALEAGVVDLATPNHSTVRLRVEPRRGGPGGPVAAR